MFAKQNKQTNKNSFLEPKDTFNQQITAFIRNSLCNTVVPFTRDTVLGNTRTSDQSSCTPHKQEWSEDSVPNRSLDLNRLLSLFESIKVRVATTFTIVC